MVAQKSGLDPEATGRENARLQGQIYGLHGRKLDERIDELLEQFGLADAGDRLVRGYSGGMQRRPAHAVGPGDPDPVRDHRRAGPDPGRRLRERRGWRGGADPDLVDPRGGFGALSNGMGLIFLKQDSLIATMVFLQLPLTFLSGAFMQEDLQPEWMQTVADFNPVNWAIEAGRSVAMESIDWTLVLTRTGLLIAFLVAAGMFATRAFRTYQQSI